MNKFYQNNENSLNLFYEKNVMATLKEEIANELGIANYNLIDKGNLSARTNGQVGGNMTKRLIAFSKFMLQTNQITVKDFLQITNSNKNEFH